MSGQRAVAKEAIVAWVLAHGLRRVRGAMLE